MRDMAFLDADHPWPEHVIRASQPFLYMAYVHRSTMGAMDKRAPSEKVMRFGKHHAKMAADRWIAKERVWVQSGAVGRGGAKFSPGKQQYDGCIIMCPPGHSKTQFAMAALEVEIAENHEVKYMWIHAKGDEAEKNVEQIKSSLSGITDNGRRFRSLYPDMRLSKHGNGVGQIKVDTGSGAKNPTVQASSVFSAKLGADLDGIVFDDYVPQSDMNEPTVRKRRADVVGGTFMTRLRGGSTFVQYTGYPWHQDDALVRVVNQARVEAKKKDGLRFRVSIQKCGGPDSNFFPLWPEVLDRKFLKKKYSQINNRRIWASNYEIDPSPDAVRIVSQLAFYDADSPGHREFQFNATKVLSLDPSATEGKNSDQTGMIYLGLGQDIVTGEDSDGDQVQRSKQYIRVLDARQFHATQSGVSAAIAAYVQEGNHVDRCLVEKAAGYGDAVAEFFEYAFRDLVDFDVELVTTGSRSKESRLRAVANMLDASSSVYSPIVQFPGVVDENGRLVPDERYSWLYHQIIDFGTASDDHCLDALTQACYALLPEIDREQHQINPGALQSARSRMDPKVRGALEKARRRMSEGAGASEVDQMNAVLN